MRTCAVPGTKSPSSNMSRTRSLKAVFPLLPINADDEGHEPAPNKSKAPLRKAR